MNLLSKKVYSPHQLQGLHLQGMSVWSDFKWSFLMCSLIIKRLTLLSVVVAAKTKRARNICAKVKRRKAKKVILYFNLKWFLFIFKQIHWGGTEKCYVHCIIVPHKPPPGSQLIFVCIFVTRESWAWKNCSACVISAPAHTGGFFLLVLHKFWEDVRECAKVTALFLQLEYPVCRTAWPVALATARLASTSAASVVHWLLSRSPARCIMGSRGGHQDGAGRKKGSPLSSPTTLAHANSVRACA